MSVSWGLKVGEWMDTVSFWFDGNVLELDPDGGGTIL